MGNILHMLKSEVDIHIKDIIKLRRELHSYPELGYHEYKTTQRLIDYLNRHNVNVYGFKDITGAIAYIGNHCKNTVGLRVDIDALPISENTGVEYSSKNKGIMHACGHDIHMSIGAGLAVILNNLKSKLPVNLKIIFQPAEECNPDGGAKALIQRGVLNNPDVSSIIGFHIWPDLKVGEIGVISGPIMASSDKFKIIINGKKSHAAEPHKGVDAIGIALNVINMIQNVIKQEIDPFEPAVVSIGQIASKGRYNIICDYVEIEGTIRTFNDEVRDKIHTRIGEILNGIMTARGGSHELHLERGYDAVVNDTELTKRFIIYASKLLGQQNLKTSIKPSLIGEDFGFFGKYAPCMYFHLGGNSIYPLHSDKFLPDEGCIEVALQLLGSFILEYNR